MGGVGVLVVNVVGVGVVGFIVVVVGVGTCVVVASAGKAEKNYYSI